MSRLRRLPFFTHRFKVSGLNLERFMNTLGKEDIPLLEARKSDRRTLDCLLYSSDLPRVSALAAEKGWKLSDAKPAQLSAFAAFLKGRVGIPIGAALALVLTITLFQFVWRVELVGVGEYRADIEAWLQEKSLGAGTPKNTVDSSALESELTWRYPDIAWFHVYVYNVTLVVEAARGVPMPALPDGIPADVTAARDGIVERIAVYAGTPRVKRGDIVRKGQTLIEGVERGADGSFTPVEARGEVIARCWRSHTVNASLYELKSGETGREHTETRLLSPWLQYPAETRTPDFLAYDTYIESRPVVGCFFPLEYQTITYREVWQEQSLRDGDEVRAQTAEAAISRLTAGLRGYDIIDKWTDYCMIDGGMISVTATAEWLMDIGEP